MISLIYFISGYLLVGVMFCAFAFLFNKLNSVRPFWDKSKVWELGLMLSWPRAIVVLFQQAKLAKKAKQNEIGEELLPCPFCGEKASLEERDGGWWARCVSRSCLVLPTSLDMDSREEAVRVWNTRY